MTPYIDTHCHLDLVENIEKNPFIEDIANIKSISVTNAPAFYDHNQRLFAGAKNIRIGIGLHPELVSTYKDQIDVFERALQTTKYVGEIGLDGSPRYKSTFALQKQIFEQLLHLTSKADNKILTVHSRNAARETIKCLQKYISNTSCKVILHWYSGNLTELKNAIDLGYYFSINHKMVKTSSGQALIKALPLQRILTETDAPFSLDDEITNRTQSLAATVDGLSTLLQISSAAIKQLIYANFADLLR